MNAMLRVDEIVVHNEEPTVLDLRLAELLGYNLPYDIRKLIARSMDELQRYGEVFATVAKTSPSGGRPGNEYHLNEGQALLIAVKSDAKNAADVREQLIRVFMAWRRGLLLPPEPASPIVELGLQYAPLGAKVDFLRWISKVRGFETAVGYMAALGLPPLPAAEYVAPSRADGREALAVLLARDLGGITVAEALRDDPDDLLPDFGIRRVKGGALLSYTAVEVARVFAETQWADGEWRAAILSLPGARRHGTTRFSSHQAKAIFLPAALLET